MIFRVADLRAHRARWIIFGGKFQGRERPFHRGILIVVIVNREIARQAQMRRFAPQQPRAERVKRRHPNVGSIAPARAQQLSDALFHHPGRFIRERDRQNRVTGHAQFDQMRHTISNDARLPGPRAGQNQ